MNFFSLKVIIHDAKCKSFKTWRTINRLRNSRIDPKYVFILSPPYSGSTLLHEILSTSSSICPVNIFGTREAQSLPEYRKLIDYKLMDDESYEYPWDKIRRILHQYSCEKRSFLLDKNPPYTFRAMQMEQRFQPSFFILLVRDPYVLAEALIRRNKMNVSKAAQKVLKYFRFQFKNLNELSQSHLIRYEDLVEDPDEEKSRLLKFLPALKALDVQKEFNAHNVISPKSRIIDMNKSKIKNLSSDAFERIKQIFIKNEELFASFNYSVERSA